jgi:hypothetical protein
MFWFSAKTFFFSHEKMAVLAWPQEVDASPIAPSCVGWGRKIEGSAYTKISKFLIFPTYRSDRPSREQGRHLVILVYEMVG